MSTLTYLFGAFATVLLLTYLRLIYALSSGEVPASCEPKECSGQKSSF